MYDGVSGAADGAANGISWQNVLPRLLTSIVSRRCADRVGWMTPSALYLLQLEMAGRLGRGNDRDRRQDEADLFLNWRSEWV